MSDPQSTSLPARLDWHIGGRPVRVDLHCHSRASTESSEALLIAIGCPESFSEPREIYDQAKRRGMDFVVLTDHDTLDGVLPLAARRADVLVGEELTCWFPEDRCKIHLLLWGITPADHAAVQGLAHDIYAVAGYVEQRQIAHAVAHPVYRQNDRLERWHLERLMLLFKGFECLNGAHSALHREAFEPLLDELTPERVRELSERHVVPPHWPRPWEKARTGGSDDHGLFNIGRTWTEFPPDTKTTADVLRCLRQGRCRPGGEAGSSLKLAHNFYGVGVRYLDRKARRDGAAPGKATFLLRALVGEGRSPRKRDLLRAGLRDGMAKLGRAATAPLRWARPRPAGATQLLADCYLRACDERLAQHPRLGGALREGLAPLGEHDDVFRFISALNRDVTGAVIDAASQAMRRGSFGGAFDAAAALAAQQLLLMPYYFAFSHQNRERPDLARVGLPPRRGRAEMRVAEFTDTFDDVNGVARFTRDIATQAGRAGRTFTVHTCVASPAHDEPYRVNFRPLATCGLPGYSGLALNLPPVPEVLEYADRQQFDAVYVDTPGPMGLVGLMVAAMLRVPVVGTYHTNFPEYVDALTGDHRLSVAAAGYVRWFYGRMATVFCRTRKSRAAVASLGIADERLAVAPAGVDDTTFNPGRQDSQLWDRLGVREPRRLMYCGRVSVEKDMPLLADAFAELCRGRRDVALVVAGDGPYAAEMARRLKGLPAYFLGFQRDGALGPLYASSDLFVFPSRTDTMGQVVLEAQACGLPVLVSDAGGPSEVMDDDVTGLVVRGQTPAAWATAVNLLLDDDARRQRMARSGPSRMARYSMAKAFDGFWDEIARAAGFDAARVAEPEMRQAPACVQEPAPAVP